MGASRYPNKHYTTITTTNLQLTLPDKTVLALNAIDLLFYDFKAANILREILVNLLRFLPNIYILLFDNSVKEGFEASQHY